jgi:hypothetical protein
MGVLARREGANDECRTRGGHARPNLGISFFNEGLLERVRVERLPIPLDPLLFASTSTQPALPQAVMGQQPITLKTSIGRITPAITVDLFDVSPASSVETF